MDPPTVPDPPESLPISWRWHLVIVGALIVAAVLVKDSVWQLKPQIFNDSPGYLVPAMNLLSGRGYGVQEDGFRQPTFPLFVALVLTPFDVTNLAACTDAHRAFCIGQAAEHRDGAQNLRVLVVANILLGSAIIVLLYALGWRLTHSLWAAALFGATYAMNVAAAYWEISILTETFVTFLLLIAVLLTLRAKPDALWGALALGVTLALLALTTPLYLVYAWIPALFLVWRAWGQGVGQLVKVTAPVIVLPVLALGGWSVWNQVVNGALTPSTVSGYSLIQTVYPVLENAPEGYDGITQTLVGYRNAQIEQTGKPTGAVSRAWRDMMQETDFTYSQVSAKLSALTVYLAWHYPAVYFDSVRQSWEKFWDYAFFHYDPIPAGVARAAAVWIDADVQATVNLVFAVAPFVLAMLAFAQHRRGLAAAPISSLQGAALLLVTVLFVAVISSLTNLGDNERYRVTVMPLEYGLISFTLWASIRMVKAGMNHRIS